MNGEEFGDFEVMVESLNQPDIQENYPMDFTGYNAPAVESSFNIETAQYTPVPLTEEPSQVNQLVNVFGKVLDVVGKTYQQVATRKEVQNLKSTPYVTSALNTLGYPSVRKAQTGIDTGILTTPIAGVKKAMASFGFSPIVLIFGVGIFFFALKGKK